MPALPGCVSQGRTKEEALEHVREAIQGYLESLPKDGIPTPRDVELEEVAVPVSWIGTSNPWLSRFESGIFNASVVSAGEL